MFSGMGLNEKIKGNELRGMIDDPMNDPSFIQLMQRVGSWYVFDYGKMPPLNPEALIIYGMGHERLTYDEKKRLKNLYDRNWKNAKKYEHPDTVFKQSKTTTEAPKSKLKDIVFDMAEAKQRLEERRINKAFKEAVKGAKGETLRPDYLKVTDEEVNQFIKSGEWK